MADGSDNDKILLQILKLAEGTSDEVKTIREVVHSNEINRATNEGLSKGKDEQVEYRIREVEGKIKAAMGYIMGLIMSVVTAIVLWLIQQFGAGGIHK